MSNKKKIKNSNTLGYRNRNVKWNANTESQVALIRKHLSQGNILKCRQ